MDPNIREYKAFTAANLPEDTLHYAAGLTDTDGTFLTQTDSATGTVTSIKVSITQAEKGIDALHFIYENFGGRVSLHLPAEGTHQASYCWHVFGPDAVDYARCIATRLYVKRREALVVLDYPLQKVHVIPIRATHARTGEVKVFDTQKDAMAFVGRRSKVSLAGDVEVRLGDWSLRKALTSEDIKAIKEKRSKIKEELVRLKKEPHDLIPDTAHPPHSYFAGIVDGDGMLDTDGKSSQTHSVSQKDRPLLDMMARIYRGNVTQKKRDGSWTWDIELFAEEVLNHIAPWLVGKKKQADLILAMAPGQALAVHGQLRELKGNYGGNTCKIDAINAGAGPSKNYKRPAKQLPKGVHPKKLKDGTMRYLALIRQGEKQETLGTFDTVDEAHATYMECKKRIDDAKRGGAPFDPATLKRPKHVQGEVPEAFYTERPTGIYLTKANTFQVRLNRVDLGTYKSYEQAKQVRADRIAGMAPASGGGGM